MKIENMNVASFKLYDDKFAPKVNNGRNVIICRAKFFFVGRQHRAFRRHRSGKYCKHATWSARSWPSLNTNRTRP